MLQRPTILTKQSQHQASPVGAGGGEQKENSIHINSNRLLRTPNAAAMSQTGPLPQQPGGMVILSNAMHRQNLDNRSGSGNQPIIEVSLTLGFWGQILPSLSILKTRFFDSSSTFF